MKNKGGIFLIARKKKNLPTKEEILFLRMGLLSKEQMPSHETEEEWRLPLRLKEEHSSRIRSKKVLVPASPLRRNSAFL